ncbi:MAG: BON domain-containing protein [Gammaproteobacteria bacterium]|nr:BON domain-containing protein [Gammaproteobacteria bacterium]
MKTELKKELEKMKTRFMRRMLAKGVILTSLTAPAAGCAIVVGNDFASGDPRIAEYEAEGNLVDGVRDDGSDVAGRVADALNDDDRFDDARVKVFNDNGRVTLVGRVDSMNDYEAMVETARDVKGVKGVVARLTVTVD